MNRQQAVNRQIAHLRVAIDKMYAAGQLVSYANYQHHIDDFEAKIDRVYDRIEKLKDANRRDYGVTHVENREGAS